MSNRARLISSLLVLLPVLVHGQALDPSTVTLDATSLRPLVLAWEMPPGAAAQWSGICADAQRRLLKK